MIVRSLVDLFLFKNLLLLLLALHGDHWLGKLLKK